MIIQISFFAAYIQNIAQKEELEKIKCLIVCHLLSDSFEEESAKKKSLLTKVPILM